MNVRFYFPRYKTAKDEMTVFCYVRERGKEICINTGCKCNPKHWDKIRQRASLRKTKNTIEKNRLRNINKILDAYENKIFNIADKLKVEDPAISFDEITREVLNHFNKKENGFFSAYDEFLKVKSANISDAALHKYKRVKVLLIEFQKVTGYKVTFNNITPLFFDKFFLFLIGNKKHLNNTAHKIIQFFKTFIIWANDRQLTDNKAYRSFKCKTEENEVIRLTNDELLGLYNLKPESEKLKRVRDLFVYQCFTGVRYSDIQNISREDIKGATWILRTKKTHQIIEIPLNAYALSILAKYKDHPQPLPVITNQKMNTYLKELCKYAKINDKIRVVKFRGNERIETIYKKYQLIGTHTARRTFISISLERGVKAEVIMKITGHKSYRMMQKYLHIADEHIKNEMEKAWGGPLSLVK